MLVARVALLVGEDVNAVPIGGRRRGKILRTTI
jgi:hypothetical protein